MENNKVFDENEVYGFSYRLIPANQLTSSQDYQRQLNPKRVREIADNYDNLKMSPIKVSVRDGKYYVFDGQNRVSALIKLYGQKVPIPAIIYKWEYEKEARWVAEQEKYEKPLKANETFQALLEAKDKDVTRFRNTCIQEGWKCDFRANPKPENNKIIAFSYLYKIVFLKKGECYLRYLLQILRDIWDGQGDSMRNEIVKGLDLVLTIYEEDIDLIALKKVLKTVTPESIINNGKSIIYRKGFRRFACAIVERYNKGRKIGKLDIGKLDS